MTFGNCIDFAVIASAFTLLEIVRHNDILAALAFLTHSQHCI
jgi:hypothetical protein